MSADEMQADIAFLLLRAGCAGACYFGSDRWTGTSSNALVSVAYGGDQDAMPWDRGDYAACVRTYVRLPTHRKTGAVRDALNAAREHYLLRYPTDRFPATRAAERLRWEALRAAQQKRRKRARRKP